MAGASWRRQTLEEHLFGPGPKRILALDGGGTLGVVEIAFLERIEATLREQHGDPSLLLCDYFDLIGGTSTGALIATALALGKSAADVRKMYFDMGPAVFSSTRVYLPLFDYPFSAEGLESALLDQVGERELQSRELRTGLAIVAKRLDTASPWVLTNNPRARYWDHRGPLDRYIPNKQYKLRDVLRASTAAPLVFEPKELVIAKPRPGTSDVAEVGVFVDGALSPHNNPALQLLMLAGIGGYGFNWRLGRDDLLMISLGTGWIRPRIRAGDVTGSSAGWVAGVGAKGLIWDGQMAALTLLQWMSRPNRPWEINGEIGNLAGDHLVAGTSPRELLTFERYDIKLEADWVNRLLGRTMTATEVEALNRITDPSVMRAAYDIASLAAEQQVEASHFPPGFSLSRLRDAPPPEIAELTKRMTDDLKSQASEQATVIGAVGHRPNRLPAAELPRIKGQLEAAMAELQGDKPAGRMVLMTGLAEGTDRISADLALARGWQLVATLPFSRARYVKDFDTPASRAEFDRLLARAASFSEAPAADGYADQDLGYAEQGRALVAASHALIAVWDGKGAHGTGGTAEVIADALARGKRVFWISTEAGAAVQRL